MLKEKLMKMFKIHFAQSLTLKDGTPVILDGDLDTGVHAFVATSDGQIPLPDGEYQLEDMTIIVIKDGIVIDIIKPGEVEPIPVEEMKEEKEEKSVEIELTQKENPEVSGELVETPVETPVEEVVEDTEDTKIKDLEAKVADITSKIDEIMAKMNMIADKFSAVQPIVKKKEDFVIKMDRDLEAKVELIKRLQKK